MGPIAAAAALVLTIILSPAYPGRARAGYSRGGPFNAPGYGARAWGMGGAAVARGGSEEAIYWNPAFLARLSANTVGLSYVNLVPGVKARQSYLAYARILKPFDREEAERPTARHAAGVMYQNLSLGLAGDGGYSENVLRLAYSYTPQEFISFGVGASVLVSRSDVAFFDSKGSAFDFGLRLQLSGRAAFGFVARNAASRVMYEDGHDETLTRSYSFALAYERFHGVDTETALTFAHGGLSRAAWGLQYSLLSGVLAVRGAVSYLASGESRVIPHLGLGVEYGKMSIDYNANLDREKAFEDTHRFSISVKL
jgi:hypothetical protein